jgi:hypothetical protein
MKVYKIIFARNEIVVCQESTMRLPNDTDIRFEQSNGQLIYAFVRADDITEACQKANMLIPRLAMQSIQQQGDPSSTPK